METKNTNLSKRIRALIVKGYNNKDIIAKLQCKPQSVYTVRYQLNKRQGLGSIGGSLATPTDGIGAPPPKRKYVRKNKTETGIIVPITSIAPEPWWKVRVKNLARALSWRG
jgi:hypothetical protein